MNRSHLKAWVLTGSILSELLFAQSSAAQVIPDATLPAGERSQVSGNPNVQIDGGVRRGGNLFHSFSQFSIPMDGSAYFNNAVDVQNIFSRVTGGSISNIDGVIRANGTANLFLLNPNGIVFGPNASLNIGGSFVATTATAIGFPNGEVFSHDATQPLPSQLLTVNPNALFFNQLTPQPIINRSTFDGMGLQVLPKQNLLLVGGPVQLDDGRLASPGSYVELASVGGVGTVSLATAGEDWQLTIPDQVMRADIALINNSRINVLAGDGGSIAIAARNLLLNNESRLRVGIDDGLGFVGAQTGGIQIEATETINLVDGATFRIEVLSGGKGNVGDMTITTGSLFLTGNSRLIAAVTGQGNVGRVTINARDTVSFGNSYVLGTVEPTGIGSNGGIRITTGTLALKEGSQLIFNTEGQGNTGSVNINARDTVSLDGSFIFNNVEQTGVGNTGGINITTGSLALTRGSQLLASTEGQGNAGSVSINARDTVSFDDGIIFNNVGQTGVGNTGGINITTGSLALTRGSQLLINTFGQGNAGSVSINARDTVSLDGSIIFNDVGQTGVGNTGGINITTGSLALTGGSQLSADTAGQGNASNITINARDRVSLDGGSLDGAIASTIFSRVGSSGVGRGGNLMITTGLLSLINGGALNTATDGQGNAGSVTIQARDSVQIGGTVPTNTFLRSGVFTTATQGSVGDGGDVTITTGSLSVSEQGQIITDVRSQGNAGNIQIQASGTVSFDGGDAISTLSEGGVGKGGNIDITGRSLSVLNNAQLSASTSGDGDAGNITVSADTVGVSSGGQLLTSTSGQGNASDITINARDRVSLDGESLDGAIGSAILSRVEPNGIGRGGNLVITTGSLFLTNGGAVNTATDGQGNAGSVTIQAQDSIQIRGRTAINPVIRSGIFTTATQGSVGDGGDVTITTGSLSVSEQGQIITDVRSQGNAGNILIQASGTVSFDGGDAISTLSEGGVGKGGNIDITGRSLSVLNNAQLSASTSGDGDAGNITVSADTVGVSSGGQLLTTTSSNGSAGDITANTPDLQLSGANSGLFAGTNSIGNAGNLTVQPRGDGQSVRVNLQDGAQISASTFNRGKGGELTITAPDSITLTGNGSVIAAGTDATGDGGNLILRTRNLNIQNQAQVTVSSSGTGSAGNLFVDADRIFLNNQGRIRADTLGGGGNINLRSPLILLRNGSNITTNATGANIPGGNIGIDTRFLVAVPNEDSNISANSEDFRGGNVRINAFSIFGIQPRLVSTPLSDITATGATSALSGTTDVSTAGIDPTSGLVALPTDFVDRSGLIAQGCPANQGNSFAIGGRGGLPPTPEQQLDDDANWQDRRRLVANQQVDGGGQGDTETASLLNSPPLPHTPIIEATGWLITPTGEISLVASTSDPTVQNRLKWSGVCSRGESSKQLK
ncbi:two-partner secretion domain-containing protein [Nostoc sp.]|uniref:two-partner secretion domain-containing protein n=1 Tax=Nostoc sp. TaxID=1180 RepID=UPI002FF5FC8F